MVRKVQYGAGSSRVKPPATNEGISMNRRIVPVVLALGAIVLVSTVANANPLFRFTEPTVAPSVPEVDFRDLGSTGIGTLVMAAGYLVQKAYKKIAGRKRN